MDQRIFDETEQNSGLMERLFVHQGISKGII
jgi:hypothetical protein